MIQTLIPSECIRDAHSLKGLARACLILLPWFSMGLIIQNAGAAAGFSIRLTHVLGLKTSRTTLAVNSQCIQEGFLGEQDKQLGGVAMTLGQAATPYGGGRVIALFSRKKCDTLTLE